MALESTLLAEREIASGRLVRPLAGMCEDVVYTGHWLVFPRSRRYARSMVLFLEGLTRELGLEISLEELDAGSTDYSAAPVLRPVTTGD